MNSVRIRSNDHEHGVAEVFENEEDGTISLVGSSSSVDLGDAEDALLVAKCIEVVAGYRDASDLTEQERERLNEIPLQK